jgi:glycosyltransferase involved in cell wall biosynthesis
MQISVIICTHNPRTDYLARTLDALKAQTLPKEQWELLLIDNASKEPLAGKWDLSWHPHARHFREEKLGLTFARLRGITEAKADLLVFVDDDNILASDYLESCNAISKDWPILGAWSGNVIPEFEVSPPNEMTPYLWCLCIRTVERDVWSNYADTKNCPWGAGMCVRSTVARCYMEKAGRNPLHTFLGRRGSELGSAEDLELATTSYELGLGTGLFHTLKITHLIPQRRLTIDYFINLIADSEATRVVFSHLHGQQLFQSTSRIDRLVALYKQFRASPLQRRIQKAFENGRHKGRAIIDTNDAKSP